MKDFYQHSGPYTLRELEDLTKAQLYGDKDYLIYDVATLQTATKEHIAVYHNPKYKDQLLSTNAGAVIMAEFNSDLKIPGSLNVLVHPLAYRMFGMIAQRFYPNKQYSAYIDPSAKISETAKVATSAYIGPFCVLEDNAVIGENTVLKSHVHIGHGVQIGNNSMIESFVAIAYALIGHNVHIKPGAKIGQNGFGFAMDDMGFYDIAQLGKVIIGDNVQIGSNTTIDKGALEDTIIGKNSRIDNLVQVAHNVQIGEHCVLVAQVGIAGSTKLGNKVVAAGQVGIAGHLQIGDGVQIAAQSGIMRDVEAGAKIAGSPAVSVRNWHRQNIQLAKLGK